MLESIFSDKLAKRKLTKEFTIPYLLWIEFKAKCNERNLNKSDAIVLLIQLFVSGKLDLLL